MNDVKPPGAVKPGGDPVPVPSFDGLATPNMPEPDRQRGQTAAGAQNEHQQSQQESINRAQEYREYGRNDKPHKDAGEKQGAEFRPGQAQQHRGFVFQKGRRSHMSFR